ncbi:hypothetical protein [Streptomyces sp. NPDC007355]|uniref:hypothetical protein n=1 Tax=Streptomyces sp. NPDC007355 TaxID=3364778 RepID=UPI00368440D6
MAADRRTVAVDPPTAERWPAIRRSGDPAIRRPAIRRPTAGGLAAGDPAAVAGSAVPMSVVAVTMER